MIANQSERFERDKVCYEQNCEHFRSLNQIMWQVPVIAMTLTGGLWFGASEVNIEGFRFLLLLLAAFGNAALIIVLQRMRFLIQQHLEKIKEFHPPGFVQSFGGTKRFEGQRVVVRTFQWLLGLSSAFSLIGLVLAFFWDTL